MDGIKLYKISRWFYKKKLIKLANIFYRINRILNNSHIPPSAKIGLNSRFAYGGIGMVIHHNAEIGSNCMIGQGCTIGGKSGSKEVPRIKDNVYIGAGARILGNIVIEHDSIIAPNAVIVKNVDSFSVMAGVPAKKIATITKENFEKFKGYGIKEYSN